MPQLRLTLLTTLTMIAIAGILLLGEAITRGLLIASVLILGGILLVLRFGKR